MAHEDSVSPHVLIVGGGFGGINAAKVLAHRKDLRISIIDKKNYHLFQPLLYQVATAGLSPADIATPIRSIFSKYPNVETFLAEAKRIDFTKSVLATDVADLSFDYLILACGASHSYFGHKDWEDFAPGLKTIEQAREIRRRIFLAFEDAERKSLKNQKKCLLTFVVVGAGPTGVELAGALGEISRQALSHEFRHIDPTCARIILLEAGPRILPSFSIESAKKARKDLENLGVQVWTERAVTGFDKNFVQVGDEKIKADAILWAAGVKPAKINQTIDCPKDAQGRLIIEQDLSLKNHPNVFVIGDMAHLTDSSGQPLPGVASVAIQEGVAAANNILADIDQKPRTNFAYRDKGQMATIGRKKAIAELGPKKVSGLLAWLIWVVVHIYYLIGFKNRLLVMIQWAISFITFKRGARIIQKETWKSFDD